MTLDFEALSNAQFTHVTHRSILDVYAKENRVRIDGETRDGEAA